MKIPPLAQAVGKGAGVATGQSEQRHHATSGSNPIPLVRWHTRQESMRLIFEHVYI